MTRGFIILGIGLAAIWAVWVLDMAAIDWQQCVASLGRPEPLPRDLGYLAARTPPGQLLTGAGLALICVAPMLVLAALRRTGAVLLGGAILLVAILWVFPPNPALFHDCDRNGPQDLAILILPLLTAGALLLTAGLSALLPRRLA